MRLSLAPNSMRLPARQGMRISRSQGRRATVVQAVLGSYQYKTRVARLRQKGVQMHEFGERVLQQGSYGDDVMQLQAYLAEQGYFNAADGLSGYFGEQTREALQAWQRDQGLSITGVFSDECKWAYVRQQETALKAAQTEALLATVASAPPPLPVTLVQSQPGLATALVGAAALAAGAVLAGPRLMGRDGLAAKAGVATLRGARWAASAVLGMTVAASRVLYGAATGAVKGAVHAAVPGPEAGASPAGAYRPSSTAAAAAAAGAPGSAELAPRLAEDEDEEAAAAAEEEEAAYLAAVAGSPTPGPQKPRRLSEEEVQQRIAVMKGEVSPRAPVPQRPSPRPLPISRSKPADDPITGSKYGTYYGGRQVRDKVKQYLEVDTGIPHGGRAGTPAARRLESMGYQMSTRPRPKQPAKPAPAAPVSQADPEPAAAAGPAQLPPPQQLAAPRWAPAQPQQPAEPFQDVVEAEAVVVETAPKILLSGTELEKAPERRGRPVPVVKPGMAAPVALQPGVGSPQAATVAAPQPAAPRPVPVVKPQKRATIGDMLRSAARNGGAGADPYAEPYALANDGGAPGLNGYNGSSNGYNGSGSSYGAGSAPSQPPVPAYQQAAGMPGSSSSTSSGSSFPVPTGSRYAAAAGGGSSRQADEEGAETPVRYNPDGSVVLASKPIKLVKPAHLLPKTYGFEQMGVRLSEEPPVAEYMTGGGAGSNGDSLSISGAYYMAGAASAGPAAADGEQQSAAAAGDDVFGGYRRRPNY